MPPDHCSKKCVFSNAAISSSVQIPRAKARTASTSRPSATAMPTRSNAAPKRFSFRDVGTDDFTCHEVAWAARAASLPGSGARLVQVLPAFFVGEVARQLSFRDLDQVVEVECPHANRRVKP